MAITPKNCNPKRETVTPRQFIYEGTAKQRQADARAKQTQLDQSTKKFQQEQAAFSKKLTRPVYGFVERQHQAMFADFVCFVAGVDVSPWTVGELSLGLSGRDGVNTATFTLQNANDNFILTLKNLRDPNNRHGGWRNSDPYHVGSQYSERAKYKIFQQKNAEVDKCWMPNNPYDRYIGIFRDPSSQCIAPGSNQRGSQDIATTTPLPESSPSKTSGFVRSARQWPLDPHRPIFHKHDPVRIFVHNPATESDEWLPGFTGFIENYSFSEDYITGESTISISCYDIRGAMAKMRVAKNIRSNDNINSYVELADGSLNSGFFKDLLVESSYSSFVAYRTLQELAQYLICGKGFASAVGPKNDQGSALTPQFFNDLAKEDREKFVAQGAIVKDVAIGPSHGTVVLTRQKDPTGVGNFKTGVVATLNQRISCDQNGAQSPDPTLEAWYQILLLGIRRSPSTGDAVGDDGLPLVQPVTGDLCAADVAAVDTALKAGNLVDAFANIQAANGLSPETQNLVIKNAVELISLTPDQEKAFNESGDGTRINSQLLAAEQALVNFDAQLDRDKAKLAGLQSAPTPPTKCKDLVTPYGRFPEADCTQVQAGSAKTNEISSLSSQISAAPQKRSQLEARYQSLLNELNQAKAKFKRNYPVQDPNASSANATKTSSSTAPVPRKHMYSYQEVLAIGSATTWKGEWSPWNGYLHYLTAGESNIRSLVDVSALEQFSNSQVEWEDRASILNEVSSKLDYQWWVTPIGDIVFEFPMYDFFPTAFGKFAPLMTFDKHIKSAEFNDESGEIPTLFIGQGSFSSQAVVQAATSEAINQYANRVILLAPTLASRIGIVPIQETFPSFVGDQPAQVVTEKAASPLSTLSKDQIKSVLDGVRSQISEPQWLQKLRVDFASPATISPSSPEYAVYNNFFAVWGASNTNLEGRQLQLAQSVAAKNAGGSGQTPAEANDNIAKSITSYVAKIKRMTTADGTTPLMSDAKVTDLASYLLQSYQIGPLPRASLQPQNDLSAAQATAERRSHIRNWSILDFQRRLANSATFSQVNEWRPFLLPNKPIYSVPRQRVGIVTTVSNSMEINSTCSTTLGLTNMKHLTILQDGSLDFTHIAGGKNSAVDYSRLLFSKTNGILPLDEAVSPSTNTPESASVIDAKTTSMVTPTAAEEAMGESSIANHYISNPDPEKNQPGIVVGKSGLVTFAGYFDDLNGNTVMVDHGDGTRTIVPNLNKISVKVGSPVSATAPVGTRDPNQTTSNIVVDCSGSTTSVPSNTAGVNQSSVARNPPPVRSTVEQANNMSLNPQVSSTR